MDGRTGSNNIQASWVGDGWALSLVLNLILVLALDHPSAEAKNLMETCSTIVKAGFGAIVGLIGGKAA
jgi:hypothetical protein